jgi:hypothetical protein
MSAPPATSDSAPSLASDGAAAVAPDASAPSRTASPRRRALVITGLLMLFGIMPGMGIPGGLMLGVADRFVIAYTGSTALRAIGETAWPLSLIVTVLLPLPLLPVLRWVGRWRRAGVGWRLLAVLGALSVWGVALSLVGLTLAVRR